VPGEVKRKCRVYDGSGNHATVIHAGKGNTATQEGMCSPPFLKMDGYTPNIL